VGHHWRWRRDVHRRQPPDPRAAPEREHQDHAFYNRIYGLTKGQYSPTSEQGKVTKSTPYGSLDHPFKPVSLALGAEASFVARSVDSDRKHLQSVMHAAADHTCTTTSCVRTHRPTTSTSLCPHQPRQT
jgi:Thiamine pyrophosphate enzyme, C-terminal TPP binding domain